MLLSQFTQTMYGVKAPSVGAPFWSAILARAFSGIGRASQLRPQLAIRADQLVIADMSVVSAFRVLMRKFVLAGRQAHQILKAIVIGNAVDVMYVVLRRDRPVRRFPDHAMFRLVSALDANQNVPLPVVNSATLPAGVLFSSDPHSVVIVDEAARISSPDSKTLIGERDEFCLAPTAAFTNARWWSPVRWWRDVVALSHAAKCRCFGVVAFDESRIAVLARREGQGIATPTLA